MFKVSVKSRTFLCFFTPCDEPEFREGYGVQEVINHDTYLRLRYLLLYDVEIGDFGISDITTVAAEKTNGRFQVTSDKRIYDTRDKIYVGGFYSRGTRSIHLSLQYTYASEVYFKSVAGHELIHAKQHYFYPFMSKNQREKGAYEYSYTTFMKAGYWGSAMSTMWTAQKLGFWGSSPNSFFLQVPY